MTRAPLARLVAAATLVVAATCVLAPISAPASAASCDSGSGVTVVVDPGALGGALMSVCDGGDQQLASDRYADVGVALTYVQRQPGFVCRVNETPASEPCVNTPPADAYWGLFWTDGKTGTWVYSSIGVTGLDVPEGGAVALAWQQGSARRTPGIAAPVHAAPTPTPTRSPTKKPSPTPSASAPAKPSATASSAPSTPSGSASPMPSASASATAAPPSATTSTPSPAGRPTKKPTRTPATRPVAAETETADVSPRPAAAPVTDATSDSGGRVPTWVTLAVLMSLLLAIGLSAHAARRRSKH